MSFTCILNKTKDMKKQKALLPLVMFSLMIPLGLVAQKDASKSFDGIKSIRMNTSSGNCKIQKSSNSTVSVKVQYTYDDSDYRPEMVKNGDRLEIREEFLKRSVSGSSDWVLSVPFNTGSGDIEVADLKINLDGTTGSGDLFLTNVSGEIKGTTGSGNIELRKVNADIRATTGSGDIDLEGSSGDISITCGSGNLNLNDSKASFRAITGSGSIRTRNLAITGSSSFATGSGNARIVLAATPESNLSVASGSGDAEVDFNGNAIQGEIVMRASKRNGRIEAPFEFDKTEEIDNGNRNDVTVEKTVVKGNSNNRIRISTGSGAAILKN
jgi:hypothetical protein